MVVKRSNKQSGDGFHIALLRGINVGGKNILPMKALAAMFCEAGCGEVRTYIQSGNVVFTAKPALVRRVPRLISKAISNGFNLEIPIVMRTAGELAKVAGNNPFLKDGADTKPLSVAFLTDRPTKAAVASLDPGHSPPDEFDVRGREIYLRYPNGVGRTRLTNQYFDSRLKLTSTVRNWRTVLKLVEMARGG